MKYFWFVIPLMLIGCSSVRFVTVSHGQLVTQDNRSVNILGNPPMVCHYENSPQTFSGYFMYQREDGAILLDDFGRGTVELYDSPVCTLGLE
jgi:uncharacterized protein YcfL